MTLRSVLAFILFVTVLGLTSVAAQTSTLTFRGRLTDTSVPATGTYDFEFELFDAQAGGNQAAPAQRLTGVAVASRNFTVQLDFGTAVFSGEDRFLEIRFKLPADSAYTPLAAREQITSAPYAIRAMIATTADVASEAFLAAQATNADTLNNLHSSSFVQTNTTAFIRNQNNAPQAADFNINGKAKADTFNAVTSYLINTTPVLRIGVPADNNLFVGAGAGVSTTGLENSFVGKDAGRANTTGFSNSFIGAFAGSKNTSGSKNSFFGRNAGQNNTTGWNNSFFGMDAGSSNTTGGGNSFFGDSAGKSNTAGTGNSFFGISAGFSNTTGGSNTFVGWVAGYSNTTGHWNTFIGKRAGYSNTTGEYNTFVGMSAGNLNASGSSNTFVGKQAGEENTRGSDNSFFGFVAGYSNTLGHRNTFFGSHSGGTNTTGAYNTLLGYYANVASNNLTHASAIGAYSVVNRDDTIVIGKTASAVFGRPADTVQIPGNLVVTGSIAKGSGSFKIDHPLDPANKYLSHSFVESPDMMNIYNGNVTTNANGEAFVMLPDYFEALNRDFRYQLTVIGAFAQAIVGEEIKGNRFKIRTDKPNVKVSWQVTGIRQDRFANENRIPNAEEKPEAEKGKCLYAPLCGGQSINGMPRKP